MTEDIKETQETMQDVHQANLKESDVKKDQYVAKSDFDDLKNQLNEVLGMLKTKETTAEHKPSLAIDLASKKLDDIASEKNAIKQEEDQIAKLAAEMDHWKSMLKEDYPDYYDALTTNDDFVKLRSKDKVKQFKVGYVMEAHKNQGEFRREENNQIMERILNSDDLEERAKLADVILPFLEEQKGYLNQSQGRNNAFNTTDIQINEFAKYENNLAKDATNNLSSLKLLESAALINKDEKAAKYYNNKFNEVLKKKQARVKYANNRNF